MGQINRQSVKGSQRGRFLTFDTRGIFDSSTVTTTWNYSSTRGWLTNKQYNDGNGPSYTHTSAGRLATRTWQRGIVTTFSHDASGSQTNIAYSDGITAAVPIVLDRLGRAVTQGEVTRTFSDAGQLLMENYASGPLPGFAVTNVYDALLRRTNVAALAATGYSFDDASRLASATHGTHSISYAYMTNSPLIQSLTFAAGGNTRLTTTRTHDYINRLTAISSAPSASSALSFEYGYNDANQRTAVTNEADAFWGYGYDSLGQVTSGKRYWSDGTLVAGQQFEYSFDDIGNRKYAAAGGDQAGANLRTNNYTANLLNQYSQRDYAGYVDVQGSAATNATVTVNNQSTYRKDQFYRKELQFTTPARPSTPASPTSRSFPVADRWGKTSSPPRRERSSCRRHLNRSRSIPMATRPPMLAGQTSGTARTGWYRWTARLPP